MKKGLVPKRFALLDIQQSIMELWRSVSDAATSGFPFLTLAQLNSHITDADVDADTATRDPNNHATNHFANGSDDLLGRIVISDTGLVMCDDTEKYIMMWDS